MGPQRPPWQPIASLFCCRPVSPSGPVRSTCSPMKGRNRMKRLVPLALLLAPTVLFAHDADDSIVHWNRIVGVITAPNVDNPVAGISAGTLPWTTHGGYAHVN